MADHVVTREVDGTRGRYVIRLNGEEAELTYRVISPTLVTADHIGAPDSFRGTGPGTALLTRLVADARTEGFKIKPLCPFVNAQRQRHPEWADVFSD